MRRLKFGIALLGAAMTAWLGILPASADDTFITLASTTSTQNSGLYGFIIPRFTERTGIKVRVVAVGTGQAIRLARKGDADVLLVHHRPSEDKFVADGFGVARFNVMYNDFIIVGPTTDPAQVHGMIDVGGALKKISNQQAPFVSRGDDSGTHKKELSLWVETGVDLKVASGSWYREAGAGMGATLNTAAAMNAYTMTDRGTWLSFKNRGDLVMLVENDPRLFNYYGIVLVNPKKHPHIKAKLGQNFVDWIISNEGQKAIASYKIRGRQAFFPNARARRR